MKTGGANETRTHKRLTADTLAGCSNTIMGLLQYIFGTK